jgi:hypothetical protein
LQISHSCNSNTKKEDTEGELDVPTAEFSWKHDEMISITVRIGNTDVSKYKPELLPEEKSLQDNSAGNNGQLCHLDIKSIFRMSLV